MEYKIVDYDKKYAEEVIKLWKYVCVDEYGFEAWEKELNEVEEHKYERLLLALVDDKVVATMAYRDIGQGVSELKRVYTYPDYRGYGISQAMLDIIIEDLKRLGFLKVFIGTYSRFARAIGFYEKNGFILKKAKGENFEYERDLKNS